ncbi:MAG: methionine--tRNA ligase [Bacteroidota bacterium]|nr:methionine--tRNA ligase [Bacteroidota bacterium]
MSERYTVTAALPYANGPIHIGHLAGAYIPADIYVRYLRLKGKDVVFICGSDEHGVAISIKAKKEGITPSEVINKYHNIIKKSFEKFGISFDHYSRTSSIIHKTTAQDFFKKMSQKKCFMLKDTIQYFDKEHNQFLPDRFVTGECPKCCYENAYGDQCEACGSSLNVEDLINPKSTLSGNEPTQKSTSHWFLKLDESEKFLKEWIDSKKNKNWKSNVLGQVKSWLDEGLKPRAVTRDLNWGIPVPLKGGENKVLYVWFDAPIGYISATKEWANLNNKEWESYWKEKETKLIHFIGKDNIVFHCIIFPAILKSMGDFILPTNVPANEFLNLEGKKLSTSKNWAIWLDDFMIDFPGKQDVLRYVLTVNAPETKDNDFTWNDFQLKNNSELVAIYGNFVNRVTVLIHKYYRGVVPSKNELTDDDNYIFDQLTKAPIKIGSLINEFRFREGCKEMMNLARIGNKYLADEEPWKKIKNHTKRVETIMYNAVQIAVSLAFLSAPFIPETSKKLLKILNIKIYPTWNQILPNKIIKSGHEIGTPKLLFDKIEDEQISIQKEKLINR